MHNVKLLDCTLRDGGYINQWDFSSRQIASAVENLTKSGIDYIEMGYLTSRLVDINGTQFESVESASRFIPEEREHSKYLVMADAAQFDPDMLCPRSADTVDGIRVVFYKRQIDQAFIISKRIAELGYDLFVQPMVTVDVFVMPMPCKS